MSKKNRKTSLLIFICSIAVASLMILLFTTCTTPQPAEKTGSITIKVVDEKFNVKNIEPALSMEITYYHISGTGPGEAVIPLTTITKPESTISFNMLDVGTWDLHLNGYNNMDVEIGYTQVLGIEVNPGITTSIEMIIEPVEGDGNFHVMMGWTPFDLLVNPSVFSQLASVNDLLTKTDLIYSLNFDNVDHVSVWPAGWYLFSFILNDNVGSPIPIETPVFGFANAVRIVRGELSEYLKVLTLEDINPAVGTIDISILEQMQQPIPITFSGEEEFVFLGNDMVVTASTALDPDLDQYLWFLNGIELPETINTITIGSALPLSKNILSLAVKKNNVLSSKSVAFNVVEEYPSITGSYVDGTDNLTLTDTTFELGWSSNIHGIKGTFSDDGINLTFYITHLKNSLMYDETYWTFESTEGQSIWYYVENSRAVAQNNVFPYTYNGINLGFTLSTFTYDFLRQ